jgi:hypothetical protein
MALDFSAKVVSVKSPILTTRGQGPVGLVDDGEECIATKSGPATDQPWCGCLARASFQRVSTPASCDMPTHFFVLELAGE